MVPAQKRATKNQRGNFLKIASEPKSKIVSKYCFFTICLKTNTNLVYFVVVYSIPTLIAGRKCNACEQE